VEPQEVIKMRNAAFKVPDGKLLKVRLEVDEDLIQEIVLMGDFFMHPEDALPELESTLVGLPLHEETLISEIEDFITINSVTLIGASAKDFVTVILMAQ
jgi:hypothetical protein